MAYDYEKAKQAYQAMSKEQQQQFVQQYKDDKNVQQFQNDYLNEINGNKSNTNTTPTTTPQADTNNAKTVSDNGMNGQNNQQNETINQNTNQNQNNNQNQFDPNEKLDEGMFKTPANDKVVVKEGDAQTTGQPDYQLDSEARTKEITDNLNYYFQNNQDYFKDRATYNSIFHYDERSEGQKAILDSYWKKKDLQDSTIKYGTGDSIVQGMNDIDITEDQLNYIKANNEGAYREWQAKQQEMIDRIISNQSVPTVDEIVNKLTDYIDKLDLGSQRYDFMQYNEELKQQYQIDSKLSALEGTIANMKSDKAKIDSVITKYSNAGADTMGGAAANFARMQRALAPYNESFAKNAQIYSAQLQSYQMSAAQVKSDLNVMYQQTQEDQRVFNNKLQALGFAMKVDSYRTPEQQADLQLQTQYKQNQISLLYQSQMNDLSLYNQYATAKLQDQIQFERTDLEVEDENQRRTNLNNVLSQYYSEYGDIIQRSQAQALNDILQYAKDHNCTVGEALTENFIKPLQSKKEYKAKVNSDYGMNVSQSIQNGMLVTTNPDGTISWVKMDDTAIPGTTQEANLNAFKTTWNNTQDWNSYISSILQNVKTGTHGGQCGSAMNDILQGAGYGRVFGNKLSDKISVCQNKYLDSNADYSTVKAGDFAVIDTGATYTDKNGNKVNAGHVGLITGFDGEYVYVLDSNGSGGKENRGQSKYKVSDLRGTYSVQGNTTSNYTSSFSGNYDTSNPYGGVSGQTTTGTNINSGGWISSLENQYKQEKWQSNDERKTVLDSYGISIQEYNEQKQRYLEYEYRNNVVKDAEEMYKTILDLEEWESKHSDLRFGDWDTEAYMEYRKTGVMPHYKFGDNDKILDGIKTLDKITGTNLLNKFTEIKQAGASFGAMSDSEWNVIKGATPILDWQLSKDEFNKRLNELKEAYGSILTTNGISLPTGQNEVKTTSTKKLSGTGYSSSISTGTNYRTIANSLLD